MVNIVTIAFVHVVLFIAIFRLMMRDDLDMDHEPLTDGPDGAKGSPDPKPQSRVAQRKARRKAEREAELRGDDRT